ncbi:MAG: hypothetical protein FWG88_11400 [Oscillospiraceae bacterium]|nr:hypothetical protein [Oscillospiraceae bacterium]
MSEFANLNPAGVEAIQVLEKELKEQGSDTYLVAYSGAAQLTLDEIILIQRLSQEELDLIVELEENLKDQDPNIAIVAFRTDED